jgi:hypothetical protein
MLLASTLAVCHARTADEGLLRRVADHVVEETSRSLVDSANGRIIADGEEIEPRAEIRIESKFKSS